MITIRNPWGEHKPFAVARTHASLGNLHAARDPAGGYIYFIEHGGEYHAIAQRAGYSKESLERIRGGIDGKFPGVCVDCRAVAHALVVLVCR